MVQYLFKGLNCHVNQQKTDMNISNVNIKTPQQTSNVQKDEFLQTM